MSSLILSFILGILGFISIVSRRSYLGVMIGIQLIFLGASSLFVLSGFGSSAYEKGSVFALFILLTSIAQLVIGYVIMGRMFSSNRNIEVENLTTLKH